MTVNVSQSTLIITIDLIRHTNTTGLSDNTILAIAQYQADALAKTLGERRDTIIDKVRVDLRNHPSEA